MWLINTKTYELEEFFGTIPPYAILSHTWEEGEVSFKDYESLATASLKPGFVKIHRTCGQALREGLQYCWVDTCCIDKRSSAELSEAINSMYNWYKNAVVCYAYLADVSTIKQLAFSKWFTRGWTLQELLAPENVTFYSAEWKKLGTKKDSELRDTISKVSGIESIYLENKSPTWHASVARRMSWMSRRKTTRVEDLAYCLLGLFEIHMPLLYGEGSQAFVRLQEEIIKQSNDQTIFCWSWKSGLVPQDWQNILAPCPAVFENSGHLYSLANYEVTSIKRYNITNAGLLIRASIVLTGSSQLSLMLLQVGKMKDLRGNYDETAHSRQFCIVLQSDSMDRVYRRYPFPEAPFQMLTGAVHHDEEVLIECGKHRIGSYENTSSAFRYTLRPWLQLRNFGMLLVRRCGLKNDTNFGSLELSHRTNNVSYYPSESLLMFSFSGPHNLREIGVAIFTNPKLDGGNTGVCFAVRKLESKNGNVEHRSHCNLLPLPRSRPENVSRQIEVDFSKYDPGVKFAANKSSAVLLADNIVYPSVNGPAKNLQLAYLALNDKNLSDILSRFDRLANPPWSTNEHESILAGA